MKTRSAKILALVAIALLVLPLLAACGGGGSTTINAELTGDYHINLSSTTAKAGDVTFHITNTATDVEHEFVVVTTDLAPADFPLDADGNVDEEQLTVLDEQEAIQAGDTVDFTVHMDPGHYVIMCNLPGHFAQGMHVEFTVQ